MNHETRTRPITGLPKVNFVGVMFTHPESCTGTDFVVTKSSGPSCTH